MDASKNNELESKIRDRFDFWSGKLPGAVETDDFRLRAIRPKIGDLKGKKILEVGCGKGRFCSQLRRTGADTTGTDLSPAMLADAMKQNPDIPFIQASATQLPFEDGSFDAVYAIEVIEHIPDLPLALQEMLRVLKKGGMLLILDRNKGSMSCHRFLAPNLLIKLWHELKNEWMYPRQFPFREKWFSVGEVLKKMRVQGAQASAEFLFSDSEIRCPWSWIFRRIPCLRYFILWTGIKQ